MFEVCFIASFLLITFWGGDVRTYTAFGFGGLQNRYGRWWWQIRMRWREKNGRGSLFEKRGNLFKVAQSGIFLRSVSDRDRFKFSKIRLEKLTSWPGVLLNLIFDLKTVRDPTENMQVQVLHFFYNLQQTRQPPSHVFLHFLLIFLPS